MKKIKTITALMCMLLIVSSCKSEKNYFDDTYDKDTSISYDLLKYIAVTPSPSDKNYTFKNYEANKDYDSFRLVDCLGSELYYYDDYSTGNCYITRLGHEKEVSFKVNPNIVPSADGYAAEKRYPLTVFAVYGNDSKNELIFADCYGNVVERMDAYGKPDIYFGGEYYYEGYCYFFVQTDYAELYLKYIVTDGVYKITKITELDYELHDAFGSSASSSSRTDSLEPVYDREGDLFSHVLYKNGIYNIYDKDKKFINSVNLSSFGFDNSNSRSLRFEKKIYYFTYNLYYENEKEKSSESSYKCKCIEINLENGEVSFDDDFKYFIVDSTVYDYEEKYHYTAFHYYELNDKREKGSVLLCSIAKENLSFNNSFVYDGFEGIPYKLDKNTIICKFSDEYFAVTKNERKHLNGIVAVNFMSGDKIICVNSDHKYFICDKNNFLDYCQNPTEMYDRIFFNRYYGDFLKVTTSTKDNKYVCTINSVKLNLNMNYYSFLEYGLITNNEGVYLSNGTRIYQYPEELIKVFTIKDTTLFQVTLGDKVVYFFVDRLAAK